MYELTTEQNVVVDAIVNGNDNIIVRAVAGAGKTFTLKRGHDALPIEAQESCLIIAFNKVFVAEMKKETRPNGENYKVKTAHGFGYVNLMKHMGRSFINGTQVNIEQNRVWKLANSLNAGTYSPDIPSWDLDNAQLASIVKTISMLKNCGMQTVIYHPDTNKWFPSAYVYEDTYENWKNLDYQYSLLHASFRNGSVEDDGYSKLFKEYISYCRMLLRESVDSVSRTNSIDFDDQLYLCLIWEVIDYDNHSLIFVDECQDLNLTQLYMKCFRGAKRFVFFGDPNQGIYGFRGADFDSYFKIKTEFNCAEYLLTNTFRCRQNICLAAIPYATIPSEMIYRDQHIMADAGVVQHRLTPPDDADMYVAMTNSSLIPVMLDFLDRDIPIKVQSEITDKLKWRFGANKEGESYMPREQVLEEIETFRRKIQEGYKGQVLRDFLQCLEVFEKSDDPIALLKKLSSRKKNRKLLSTVHQVKGDEAESVVFLDFFKTPQLSQLKALKYVAMTRAKSRLVLIVQT